MAMRLPVLLLGCGLLAACNFPKDDGATVGSKGLWVANGTSVVEYNPAQLGGGTSATAPHVSISSEVIGTPSGVAFDPMGNLWVVDPTAMINGAATPALYEFSAAQLAALATDNSPEPVAVITSAFMQAPRQIVIDTLGNAWIADPTANAVLTYTQAQLSKTGTNTVGPVLLITSSQFNGVSGVAFDSGGNMWIANNGTTAAAGTTMVEIAKAHIPAIPEMGTSTPQLVADVTLSDSGGATIQAPWGVVFDSSDTLWATNSGTSTVVGFAKASLVTGAPAPAVTLSATTVGTDPTLDKPRGICMDDVGNMAVVSSGIAVYAAAERAATGAPTPATFITGDGTAQGCAFGPVVK
jgi:hypothetical protein